MYVVPVAKAKVPVEVDLVRTISSLLLCLSSSSDSTGFINSMLLDQAHGLRILIQILDNPGIDTFISKAVNSTLFAMVSNPTALGTILKTLASDKSVNITTLRWLTTSVAVLTSDYDALEDVYVTEESPHPVEGGTMYIREVTCPLASKLIITFDPKSEFENAELHLLSDDSKFTFRKDNKPTHSIEIAGTYFRLEYSTSGLSKWGYRMDVRAVFDLYFDVASSKHVVLENDGAKLLTTALKSRDPLTQLMASRALANMSFPLPAAKEFSLDNVGKQLSLQCIGQLVSLADKKVSMPSILTTLNPINKSASLISLHATIMDSMKNSPYYFEVTLLNEGNLMLGLCSECPKFDDITINSIPQTCILLDSAASAIRWGSENRPITLKSWLEGDTIAVLSDPKSHQITFFLNGSPITSSFTIDKGNKVGQWAAGFLPTAFLEPDSGLYWNLGQEPFLFSNGSVTSATVLEVTRGPVPAVDFQRRKWLQISWLFADQSNIVARPLVPEKNVLILQENEMRIRENYLLYNHRRQIARGLYGASLMMTNEQSLRHAMTLCKSDDLSTKRWAVLILLRALEMNDVPGEVIQNARSKISGDMAALQGIADVCYAEMVDLNRIINALFINSDLGFEFAEKYLKLHRSLSSTSAYIFQSRHPYECMEDSVSEIFIQGAKELEIIFDSQTKTEANYDHITFYTQDPRKVENPSQYEVGKYSGPFSNFPSAESPLVIPHDKAWCRFISDGSNVEWGWMFVAREKGVTSVSRKGGQDDPLSEYDEMSFEEQVVVIENPSHPYESKQSAWKFEVSVNGADALKVAFDPMTSTHADDKIVFWRDESLSEKFEVDFSYSGNSSCSFPGIGISSVVIPAGRFWVSFTTCDRNDDLEEHWGFRFAASATVLPKDPWPEFLARKHIMTFESAHEYSNSMSEHTSISVSFPNCKSVNIVFDPQTNTELNYDYLTFYKDSRRTEYWGSEKYSGSTPNCWPGIDSPLSIPATDFVLSFTTDSSNTFWGYKFYVVPWEPSRFEIWAGESGEIVETTHPVDGSRNFIVDFGGVEAIEIAFDVRSQLSEADYIELLSTSDRSTKITGSHRLCMSNLPNIDKPLVVGADSFVLAYTKSNSESLWGFRVACRPLFHLSKLQLAKLSKLKASSQRNVFAEALQHDADRKTCELLASFLLRTAYYATRPSDLDSPLFRRIIDCPRNERGNYASFMNVTGCVTLPGAIDIEVAFDERCLTEREVDILQFYRDACCSRTSKLEGKSFSGKYTEDWDFRLENTSRLCYSFRSDATRNAWGFKFDITSTTGCQSVPHRAALIATPELFAEVMAQIEGSSSLSDWAGLLLVNALCEDTTRNRLIASHGCQWIKDLMASKNSHTQLASILCLFLNAPPGEPRVWIMQDQFSKLVHDQDFIQSFISMLLSEHSEVSGAAVLALQSCFNIQHASVTGILVECLTIENDKSQERVLHEMSKADIVPSVAEDYIKYGVISRIRALLKTSTDPAIDAQAIKALTKLMKYDESIRELLFTVDDGHDLVNQCVGLVTFEDGVAFISQMLHVHPVHGNVMSLLVRGEDIGSFQVPCVFGIGKSCQPVWVPYATAEQLRSQSHCAPDPEVILRANPSISLWVFPETVNLNDGLPILYKGKSQSSLQNGSGSGQTVRLDILAKKGKVYYEVTYGTASNIICGWSNIDTSCTEAFGTDESAYGINLSSSVQSRQVWSGFVTNPAFPEVSGCRVGDVLGVALDFDNGVMSFYINGALLPDFTFTSATHSNVSPLIGENIKDSVNGFDWKKGFYPTVFLGADERCSINAGQDPFKYKLDTHEGVLQAVSKEIIVPPLLSRLTANRGEGAVWITIGHDMYYQVDKAENFNWMSLVLNTSLRLQLQFGVVNEAKVETIVTLCAETATGPYIWTHCEVAFDPNSVRLVVNGRTEASYFFGKSSLLMNTNDICIGACFNGTFVADDSGKMWISHLNFFNSAPDGESIPRHLRCAKMIEASISPEFVEKLVASALEDRAEQSVRSISLLTQLFRCSYENSRIAHLVGESSLSHIIKKCLDGVITENDGLEGVFVIEAMAAFSLTPIGKHALISMDVLRLLLAMSAREFHFWIELTIANLYLSADEATALASKLSVPKDELYYFSKRINPFSSRPEDKSIWKELPVAVNVMTQDPATFVRIARSIGLPIYHGRLDDATPLPLKYDEHFALWCVDCYGLLTLDSTNSSMCDLQPVIIETSSHPYRSNDAMSGTICVAGAVTLKCKFDPQSKTENGPDYLKIWKNADKVDQIAGPGSDGKFTGAGADMWPPFEVHGNSFFYEWSSDYSVEEWGFKLEVLPLAFQLPNSELVRTEIVQSGGIVPLVDMVAHAKDPYLRKGAKRALSQLSNIEKVRGLVDSKDGLETLLKTVTLLRYKVTSTSGAAGTKHSTPSDLPPDVLVPEGTEVLVCRRRWFTSKNVADDFHGMPKDGYYRLCIEEPQEYHGFWISAIIDGQAQVEEMETDKESLRLLGLLAQSAKSRSRLIDVGKMATLLKLVKLEDLECSLTVAMALSDVASSQYEWLKLCAADEIRLHWDSREGMAYFYSLQHFEYYPVTNFSSTLPSHDMTRENPVGYQVCLNGILGTVISFDEPLLHVKWATPLPTGESESVLSSTEVHVVRDTHGNIVGYPANECELLIDMECHLNRSVEVHIFNEPEMQKAVKMFTLDEESKDSAKAGTRASKSGASENDGKPFLLSSRTLYMKMVGDLSALPDSAYFRMHVLPKYDVRAPIRISYEEEAFAFLERVVTTTNEYNDDIRSHAITALGRLVAPVEITSPNSQQCFRPSQYRDRFISSAAFPSILMALHSSNSKLSKPSGLALTRLFPDMAQLVDTLPLLRHLAIHENPQLTSLIAFVICQLTRSRFRPMFSTLHAEPAPVKINTKLDSNTIHNFPFGVYSKNSESCTMFEVEFPGATSISLLFHPNSAINSHQSAGKQLEERDVIHIYADRARSVLLHTITSAKLAELISSGDLIFEDNRSSLYFTFLEGHSLERGGCDKPGFAVISNAKYSDFEYIASIGPTYRKGQKVLEHDNTVEVGCIKFLFCNTIEIMFVRLLCSTVPTDVLSFYRDPSCEPQYLEKSFSGPSSTWQDFTYDGSTLYYRFDVISEKVCEGGFEFHARPRFEYISDARVASNVNAFFGELNGPGESYGDLGLKYLTPLLDSKHPLTRKWASIAYGQLSTFNGKLIDPFKQRASRAGKKRAPVKDDKTESTVSTSNIQLHLFPSRYDTLPATDRLLENYGMDFAARMADDKDPVIRRQGCIALAQFLLCKDGRAQMMNDGYWRVLVAVCSRTISSRSALDCEACRYSCWILSELTKQKDGSLHEIASTALGPLSACLSSEDSVISSFAAEATFSLASHPANRKLLLANGIQFFVNAATRENSLLSGNSHALALQQGASKALLGLVISSDSVDDIKQALQYKTANALLMSIKSVYRAARDIDMSETQSLSAIPEAVVNITPLVVAALDKFSKWKLELSPLMGDSIEVWTSIVDTLCKLLTRRLKNEQLADRFKSLRRQIVDVLIEFLLVDVPILRINIMRSLITIASFSWKEIGIHVFEAIIRAVESDSQWTKVVIKNRLQFNESIVAPCLSIFASGNLINPFDENTGLVLDLFRSFCTVEGRPDSENQDVILAAVKHTLRGTVSVSPCQFFFRCRDNDVGLDNLELSSTSINVDRVWRTLRQFYLFELRASTRNFLHSTLMLWVALCAGTNQNAILHYSSLLSFDQIFESMMWQYTEGNVKLTSQASVFVNLMTNIYIDTEPRRDSDHLDYECKDVMLDDFSGVWKRVPARHNLSRERQEMLIFYANRFIGGGRISHGPSRFATHIKEHHLTLDLAIQKGSAMGVNYAKAVLDMVKHMVSYGFYSVFDSDLEILETAIVNVCDRSSSYVSQHVVSLRHQLLDILELISQHKISICVDEVTDLMLHLQGQNATFSSMDVAAMTSRMYQLVVENSDPCSIAAGARVHMNYDLESTERHVEYEGVVLNVSNQTLVKPVSVLWWKRPGANILASDKNIAFEKTGSICGIRYPRLRTLFRTRFSEPSQPEILQAMILRQMGSLSVDDTPHLVRSAIRLLVTSRNGMYSLLGKLGQLTLLTSQEKAGFSLLEQHNSSLKQMSLSGNMSTAKQQEIEALLSMLTHALEGRTVFGSVNVGSRVVRASDVTNEDFTDDDCEGEIVETLTDPRGGLTVTVKWYNENSTISTHSFGVDGKFEVVLVTPANPFVAQLCARVIGIHMSVMKFLGDDFFRRNLESESSGILRGCYSILRAFLRHNSENQELIAGETNFVLIMVSHILLRCGSIETLYLAFEHPKMYTQISYVLVKSLTTSIEDNFDRTDHTIAVVTLLCKALPNEAMMDIIFDSASGDDSNDASRLHGAQNMIFLTLLKTVTRVKAFLQHPGEVSNVTQFDTAVLKLLSLCVYRNMKLRHRIAEEHMCMTNTPEFLQVFHAVEANACGFRTRIASMTPWVKFLSVWFDGSSDMRTFDPSIVQVLKQDFETFRSAYDASVAVQTDITKGDETVYIESSHPYTSSCESWQEVHVPHARRLKIAFTATSITEANNDYLKILKCPPITEDGLVVYKTIVEVPCTREVDAASTVVHTISQSTVVKVLASTKIQTGMGDETTCRGMIVHPSEYANSWMPLTPRTVQMCNENGDVWSRVWAKERFSGKNWPSVNNPLVIHDNKFIVYFHSDYSVEAWGWKLSAKALCDDEFPDMVACQDDDFNLALSKPGVRVFESAHDYACDLNTFETISIPGAEGIAIIFSPETLTEKTYDYLKFYQDDTHTAVWGADKYHGDGTDTPWPGVDGAAALYIPKESFVLHFHTDGSNVAWGYRFAAIPGPPPPSIFDKKINETGAVHFQMRPTLNNDFTFNLSKSDNITVRNDGPISARAIRMDDCTIDDIYDSLMLTYPDKVVIMESVHPYEQHEMDIWKSVSITNASATRVVFDERSATRSNIDILTFTDARSPDDVFQFEVQMSGSDFKNHPPHGSLRVDASTFSVRFTTGGAGEVVEDDISALWGYRCLIYDDALEPIVAKITNARCTIDPGEPVTPLRLDVAHSSVIIDRGVSVNYITDVDNADDKTCEQSFVPLWVDVAALELNPPTEEVFILAPTNSPGYKTNGIEIIFHEDTEVGLKDKIEVFLEDSNVVETYSIDNKDAFPTVDQPLQIRTEAAVKVKYTRYSPIARGLRLCALRTYIKPNIFDAITRLPNAAGKYKIYESQHPYPNNSDYTFGTTFQGTSRIAVAFDPMTSTESSYDYVEIGGNRYSGGRGGSEKTFPMFDPYVEPSLVFDGNRFEAKFVSDSSNDDWGYRLIAYDANLLVACREECVPDIVVEEEMRRPKDDIFGFFENRSSCNQTVKIHMPVVTCAYFEILFSSMSTKDCFAQIGCITNDAKVDINTPQNGEWPFCLGIGQFKGSYCIDGINDPAYHSMKWVDGTSKSLSQDIQFKEGVVIGVLMDVSGKQISFFVDGEDIGAVINQGPAVSWARGLCPAFTLMPGQSLTVNVGQQKTIYGQSYSTVLDSYIPNSENGHTLCFDESWCEWKPCSVGHLVYEDPSHKHVQEYLLTLSTIFDKLGISSQRLESLSVREGNKESQALVTSGHQSGIELVIRRIRNMLHPFRALMEELAAYQLYQCKVSYAHFPCGPRLTTYVSDILVPKDKTTDTWLRPVNNEIGVPLHQRLLDLGIVQSVLLSNLDSIFLYLTASHSQTENKTSKKLFSDAKLEFVVAPRNRSDSVAFNASRMTQPPILPMAMDEYLSGGGVNAYLECESDHQRFMLASNLINTVLTFGLENEKTKRDETALTVGRALKALARSISQNEFDHPDHDVQVNHTEKAMPDTYVTISEKYTLSVVQSTLVSIGTVELICYLLSSALPQLQDEGVELGIYVLALIHRGAQSKFAECFSSSIDGHHFQHVGRNFLEVVAQRLCSFSSSIVGLCGMNKLALLHSTTQLLAFLECMCDGQFTPAQNKMVATKSASGDSIVVLVVHILGVVVTNVKAIGSFIVDSNPDELLYLLALADQALDTLIDFVQGPHLESQMLMMSGDMIRIIHELFDMVYSIRLVVFKELDACGLLPTLKECDRLQSAFRKGELMQAKKLAGGSVLGRIVKVLSQMECRMLELLSAVLESGSEESALEVAVSNIARFQALLQNVEMAVFIERFKACWASVVFDPSKHLTLLNTPRVERTASDMKASSRRKAGNSRSIMSRTYAKTRFIIDQLKQIVGIVNGDTDISFQPDNVMAHMSQDDKNLCFRVWSLRSDEDVEKAITLAHSYYSIITMTCDNLTNKLFVAKCGDTMASKLKDIVDLWNPRLPTSLVSVEEEIGFRNYFASIEIVTGKAVLRKLYFVIPRNCREQAKNSLVIASKENLLENVKRDSTEEKLDDFLEKSLEVRDVIIQQQYLLQSINVKPLFRFFSRYGSVFVGLSFLMTLLINIILLVFVTNAYSSEDFYLPPTMKVVVQRAGIVHIILSGMVLNYFMMGKALVTINNGYKWKRNVTKGLIALEWLEALFGSGADAIFNILCAILPNFVWFIYFFLSDIKTWYYLAYVFFSFLGHLKSPSYFCFHVLDVVMHIPILGYVMKSVTMNIGQVVVTFLLGAVFMWIYSVIAVYYFGYNQYTYGDYPDDYTWSATLASTFLQHMDYGLRSAPIFATYDGNATEKYFFDISYQIFIIVIMVAIITGIIIDTFSDLRANRAAVDENQLNFCFVCGFGRETFERHR